MTWERPAPRIVASSTLSKLVIRMAPPDRGALLKEEIMERVIEHGCGLRASPWGHGPAGPGGTHLRHYGRRTPRPARLAGSTRSHACRHGERRRLLEADLLRPRGGVHVCAGQPGAHGQVPGRKTDVQDCVWIAQLLEHGLLRGSFVPPAPIRELRDLTRYRKTIASSPEGPCRSGHRSNA